MRWFLFFFILMSQLGLAYGPDYALCAQKQQDLYHQLSELYERKAEELINASFAMASKTEDEKRLQTITYVLGHDSFMRSESMKLIAAKFESSTMTDTLRLFKRVLTISILANLSVKDVSQILQSWVSDKKFNALAYKNLRIRAVEYMAEVILLLGASKYISKLGEVEAHVAGTIAYLGVKGGIDISKQLLTTGSVSAVTGGSLLRWAGGPGGVALMLAPLFMSGTLPYERQWAKAMQKLPHLLLTPMELSSLQNVRLSEDDRARVHCLAWIEQDGLMEDNVEKLLKMAEKEISEPIRKERAMLHFKSQKLPDYTRTAVDNTYTGLPIILPRR